VIAQTVVVREEGVDLGFEIVREEVVLQQNAASARLSLAMLVLLRSAALPMIMKLRGAASAV
jgi:hypothetical protein